VLTPTWPGWCITPTAAVRSGHSLHRAPGCRRRDPFGRQQGDSHDNAAATLLDREVIFHDIVLELGGNEALAVLQAVLHRLVDDTLPRPTTPTSPVTVVDGAAGPTHKEVLRLAGARAGRARLAHRWRLQVDVRADRLTGAPLRDLLLRPGSRSTHRWRFRRAPGAVGVVARQTVSAGMGRVARPVDDCYLSVP
jgi:hypothetical protein